MSPSSEVHWPLSHWRRSSVLGASHLVGDSEGRPVDEGRVSGLEEGRSNPSVGKKKKRAWRAVHTVALVSLCCHFFCHFFCHKHHSFDTHTHTHTHLCKK